MSALILQSGITEEEFFSLSALQNLINTLTTEYTLSVKAVLKNSSHQHAASFVKLQCSISSVRKTQAASTYALLELCHEYNLDIQN